jgi:HEAT repeat protein
LQAPREAAQDGSLPRRLRAHVPRSISRFGSEAAADLLLDLLEHDPDGWVRFKALRGLGKLREHFAQPKRLRRVHAAVRSNLQEALMYLTARLDLNRAREADAGLDTPGGRLLLAALENKQGFAVDRAVRLLGLRHQGDVIHNIRQALGRTDARLRADSAELLVHRAPHDLASATTALLGRGDDEWRLAQAAAALSYAWQRREHTERLRELLTAPSEAVRGVAMFHARELGVSLDAHMALPVAPARPRPAFGRELLELSDRLLEPPLTAAHLRRMS